LKTVCFPACIGVIVQLSVKYIVCDFMI